MAWFAIAATVVGTGMSMYGQHQAAKAQADMLQQQTDWTNQTQKLQAEWNRDQLAKQAKYDETTAQKNMRRERENNKRELARRRAVNARGGLMETGAVSDNLIEASERHQTEIDDIWDKASTEAHRLREQGAMSIWEAATGKAGRDWQTAAQKGVIKQKAVTDMWSSAIKGAGQVYSAGAAGGAWGGAPTPNANQIAPLKALPPTSY